VPEPPDSDWATTEDHRNQCRRFCFLGSPRRCSSQEHRVRIPSEESRWDRVARRYKGCSLFLDFNDRDSGVLKPATRRICETIFYRPDSYFFFSSFGFETLHGLIRHSSYYYYYY
jgi:hypothetical protein